MPKNKFNVAAFFIFLAALIIYLPALKSGFLWDDYQWIVWNPNLKDLTGLAKIWFDLFSAEAYYPLTITSFWLEYHIWQLEPLGYHLTNILLHSANAVLIALVLQKLKIPGALLAAAIFAFHPIQVESVVWITERKNVLSLFLHLLATLSYIRFYNLDESGAERIFRPRFYLWTLFFFLGSILSKSTACSFPFFAILLLWWKGKKIRLRDLLLLLPMATLSLMIGLVNISADRISIGARAIDFSWSFWDRFLIAGKAFWFYIGKLFWPVNLSFIYSRWDAHSISSSYFIFFVLIAVVLFASKKILSEQKWKGLMAAFLFFTINLIPVSGFLNVSFFAYSFVANWWLYLPSISLFVLSGFVLQKFFDRRAFLAKSVLSGMFLLTLAVLTAVRLFDFQNEKTIWMDTGQKIPKSAWVRFQMGLAFQRSGEIAGAINQYAEAIKLDPTHVGALNNLGVIMSGLGRFDQAEILFSEVLNHRPDDDRARKNLDFALTKQGEMAEIVNQ